MTTQVCKLAIAPRVSRKKYDRAMAMSKSPVRVKKMLRKADDCNEYMCVIAMMHIVQIEATRDMEHAATVTLELK